MNDEHLRHIPQSPSADIVRLAPERLAGLLGDSLPNALSPAQARVAIEMHRGGRDAQAIAERVRASIVAVKAFLDSIKPAKAAPAAAAPAEPAPPAVEQLEAASTVKPAPAATPVLTPTPRPAPIPDVELTGLQQAVIRRLRKVRVPASVIALGMRLTPDQVQRVAGEIP